MSNLIDRGFQSWTRALEREPQTGEVTVVDPDSGGEYICRLQSLTSSDVKEIGSLAWTDRLENVGPILLVGGLVEPRLDLGQATQLWVENEEMALLLCREICKLSRFPALVVAFWNLAYLQCKGGI